MNVKVSDVVSKFIMLSGIDETEREKWIPLCNKCLRDIEGMIKGEVFNSFDIARIEDACSVLAFYNYILLTSAREDKSFSAGDISVTKNENACKHAYNLWLDAKAAISDLINDRDFSFCAVKYR